MNWLAIFYIFFLQVLDKECDILYYMVILQLRKCLCASLFERYISHILDYYKLYSLYNYLKTLFIIRKKYFNELLPFSIYL